MDNTSIAIFNESKERFALVMQEAKDLDIVNNLAGAFDTALVVSKLTEILTDDIMKQVFMPLMNKKIGFHTDQDPSKPRNGVAPKPYSIDVVRTAIIDAAANGLLPTGNQFNIIAGNMYPTKEGYTALLAKLKQTMNLVYMFEFDPETSVKSADESYVAIPCRISYKTNRDDLKGYFRYVALVKSNGTTSTTDQLRGKAERKCKKAFYEFLTGLDLGDGDADTVDIPYEVVTEKKSASDKAREAMEALRAKKEREAAEAEFQQALFEDEQKREDR